MPDTPAVGSAAELAELFPSARVVRVLEPLDAGAPTKHRAAAEVVVRPLNAIEAAQLVTRMQPLFDAYDPTKTPIQLITDHMDVVTDIAATATDRDGAWLRALDAGDCLNVLVSVIEANENFLRVVGDLVAGPTGKRLATMFGSAGQTPSPSSPSTASAPRKPLSSFQPRSKQ